MQYMIKDGFYYDKMYVKGPIFIYLYIYILFFIWSIAERYLFDLKNPQLF